MNNVNVGCGIVIGVFIFILYKMCAVMQKCKRAPKPQGVYRRRRDDKLLRDAGRLTAAPYTYWCSAGQHTWSLFCIGRTTPPAMDGATVDCVAHACTYSVDDDGE